ncbi:MAG: GNAT family N-acetyltransferase [Bacilli bacterium]|nr:GNAT family N-acetyltransferase [Bacilli bacterium]
MKSANDSEDRYLFAVYDGETIVANCFLEFLTNIKTKHRGRIGIAVTSNYRGMGIGSLLFDEMISIARNRNGVTQLELEVIKENERAKRLYTSKGFVKTGDRPRVLKLPNGTYLDEEMMILYLDR